MQNQFIITIDNNVSQDFVLNFFKNINFIKSIKLKSEKKDTKININESTLLSEISLKEEWLSEEDNQWDKVL
ncbi:MAG: hypothetical protein A2033_03220 [Bacteroidetes bacterium GWA2_31_9]|nr:MAG: hypothetical protein A2033_03220 [Bacteroidetes bacterium GWA2_31_9]